MLTESLLLAISGGVLGLVLSAATLKLLVTFAEGLTTRAAEISLDTNVLMFTLATSVLTGLIFGSIPAFSSRFDVAPALRDGNRTTHSGQGLRNALIVAQVAASFMLLIAVGPHAAQPDQAAERQPGIPHGEPAHRAGRHELQSLSAQHPAGTSEPRRWPRTGRSTKRSCERFLA